MMRQSMKNIIIYNLFLILICYGCSKENTQNGQVPLLKTKWILTNIQDTKTNVITDYPSEVDQQWGTEYIILTDSLNTIIIKGLCNDGGGNYLVNTNSDSITFSDLFMTLVLCKYEEWELYLWDNLRTAYKYKINDNKLTIYSKGAYNLNFIQNKN